MRFENVRAHNPSDSVHTAKNVVLAGVKSVTIYDPEPVTLQDLSSQVCGGMFSSSVLIKRITVFPPPRGRWQAQSCGHLAPPRGA